MGSLECIGKKGKQPETKIGQGALTPYTANVLESLKTAKPQLLPVFAYYGARRGWIIIPERLRETKVDYSQPTSALVGALESLSDFKEMLKWFDRQEIAELRANKHGSGEDWIESPLLYEVREALNVILGGAYKYPRFDKNHKFVIEKVDGGEVLQVSQLSQGYQSMLALGMDFARRLALANLHLVADEENFHWAELHGVYWERWKRANDEDFPGYGPRLAPAVMLVDEIDLHLHPSWQQRVLDDLMRAFPGTQFIVTSHSPQSCPPSARKTFASLKRWLMAPGEHGSRSATRTRTPILSRWKQSWVAMPTRHFSSLTSYVNTSASWGTISTILLAR